MAKVELPLGLMKAINEKNLVIFAGAGLSYNLKNTTGEKVKDWKNLIEKLLESLAGKGYNVEHLQALTGKRKPINILKSIEKDKNIGKNEIIKFVKKFYSLDMRKSNNYTLHKKLFQISKKIVTTNYDNAFENASHPQQINVVFMGRDKELVSLNNQNEFTLFKLHGCISDDESMVILPSDYNALYKKRSNMDTKRIIFYLQNLIANKTILFIGCSMGDFQINRIFQNIKDLLSEYDTRNHFIIAKKDVIDAKLSNFLELIKIDNYSDVEQVIETIWAKKKELEQEDYKVRWLKEELKKLKNKDNQTLQHFQKAIEYHLDKNYEEAIVRYKMSIYEEDGSNAATFNGWGNALCYLAELNSDENLYHESIEKYKKAIELNPNYADAFNNWGLALCYLAELNSDENLYHESIEKYKKAIELNPNYADAFNNCGIALHGLAKLKNDENLYRESFEKYEKAVELNPNHADVFYNWGNALFNLAKLKNDENLYRESFEKYEKAVELNPNHAVAFYNWGNALCYLAELNSDENLYHESIEKYKKAIELNPNYADAFNNLELALRRLVKLKNDEKLCHESIEKCKKAVELNPNDAYAFYNWGLALRKLVKLEKDKAVFKQKFEEYLSIYERIENADCYNISCIYALLKDKKSALFYLNLSLERKEIDIDYVINDEDWKEYLEDEEFKELIDRYR